MEAKQHLVVHSVPIHQSKPLREIWGTKCSVSFSMMAPQTAAGNVYFSYDQTRASGSPDHCKITPQAM